MSTPTDPLAGFLEITLTVPDDFLIIKETLTRIGIKSITKRTLTQSCHIFTKRGRIFIVHFKQLFLLDSKPSTITLEDFQRRNTIARLLEEWGLLKIMNSELIVEQGRIDLSAIDILPFKEKANWSLISKYQIGGTKRTSYNRI